MKLHFKQRFFSWFDSYDIYDEDGEVFFTVEGKMSWGHKLVIYDRRGNEIAMVQQEVLTLLPRFDLYIGGSLAGTMSKELSFFKPRYNIDFNGWYIEGNFMEWDYSIRDGSGAEIAVVSKELMHWTDQYVIETLYDEDALGALMVVLAIDAEKCSRN